VAADKTKWRQLVKHVKHQWTMRPWRKKERDFRLEKCQMSKVIAIIVSKMMSRCVGTVRRDAI